MVGLSRLELLTSRLSGVRSNRLSYRPIIWRERRIFVPSCVTASNTSVDVAPLRLHSRFPHSALCIKTSASLRFTYKGVTYADINGGDEENRTPDPLLARQVLSQLSYAPMLLQKRDLRA